MAFKHILHPGKRRMLSAYAEMGVVKSAAKVAQVSRESHYSWLADDPEYVAAFARARVMAGDALEDEAIRRGQIKSDKLLLAALAALKPTVWGRRVDHKHTGEVLHAHVDLSSLDDSELEQLERILGKARVGDHSGSDSGGTGETGGAEAGQDVSGDGAAGETELPEAP